MTIKEDCLNWHYFTERMVYVCDFGCSFPISWSLTLVLYCHRLYCHASFHYFTGVKCLTYTGRATWGLILEIFHLLALLLAFSSWMDLKRIPTLHSLLRDFRADKTFNVGQRAESKFEPMPVIWNSLLETLPESNWKFWLQINGKLMGQRSFTI